MEVNERLAAVFGSMDAAGVRWCLLRGAGELEAPVGDVDLLVDVRDRPRLPALMEKTGFLHLRTVGRSQSFFIGRDAAKGSRLLIHAVDRLAFGRFYRYELLPAEPVLATAHRMGSVPVAAPGDEFWITLLHCLLDRGVVPQKHRERLAQLAHAADPRHPLVASLPDPAGLVALATTERWSDLESSAPAVERAVSCRRARFRAIVNRSSLYTNKVSEAVRRPGFDVALLAPDGAGKSTVASLLVERFPLPVHCEYLGVYGRDFPQPRWGAPGAGLAFRLVVVWTRWVRGRWHRARRRLVIYDRHPMEATAGDSHESMSTRIRRTLLHRALPPPGLVVVLDAPGELLHTRSGEHDPAALDQQRQRYAALARDVGAVVVDASRDLDDVVETVAAAIWDRCLQRSRRR